MVLTSRSGIRDLNSLYPYYCIETLDLKYVFNLKIQHINLALIVF